MSNIIIIRKSLFVLIFFAFIIGLYYLIQYIYSVYKHTPDKIVQTTTPVQTTTQVFINIPEPDKIYIDFGRDANAKSFGILNKYNWFNHLPNNTLKSIIIIVNKLNTMSQIPASLYAAIINIENEVIYERKISDLSPSGQIVINPLYKAKYSRGDCFYDTPNLLVNDTYTFNFKVITDAQDCNFDISTYIIF